MPIESTGLGVEDQVLVLNGLETVKHTCQDGWGLPRIPHRSTPLAPPETLRFGRQHPVCVGRSTAFGVHEIWV